MYVCQMPLHKVNKMCNYCTMSCVSKLGIVVCTKAIADKFTYIQTHAQTGKDMYRCALVSVACSVVFSGNGKSVMFMYPSKMKSTYY